jgi:outer membrane protein TolC
MTKIWIYNSALSAFLSAAALLAQTPFPGVPGGQRKASSSPAAAERGPGIVSSGISGSVVSGTATSEVLKLTLQDAIDRGLRYNLALTESGEDERLRRSQRLLALSELLPEITVRPSAAGQQINLAAFGFTGFPGVPTVVGPFAVVDARANVSQTLFDLRKRRGLRANRMNEAVAAYLSADMRGRVSVFVAGLYLQALAARSRVDAQRGQVQAAQSVYQQAVDRHDAGTVPRIDVLREQVQVDEEQNRLIAYEGDFDKRKIDLARAIGLPSGQHIELADSMPDQAWPDTITLDATLEQALAQRSDYKAALAAVTAAELSRSAAQAGRYPTADLEANYGVIGPSPASMHGTFAVAAGVTIPVFQGGKTKAEVEAADTLLRRRQAELGDLRGKIEAEVRSAFIDLRSSARQVEVASRAAGLAREQLEEARSRFAAGVTNNLEVVQAQQATAVANENYIAALFSLNIAKASFLLARGDAERTIQEFLRRTEP